MSDTITTVRKEILEDAKAEIDERIAVATEIRDGYKSRLEATTNHVYEIVGEKWEKIIAAFDAEIDALLLEKDNLPDVLFSDRADEIEPTEAEAQALERRLAQVSTTEIALNVAQYNVEHATPNNSEWAKRRLAEEEAKAKRSRRKKDYFNPRDVAILGGDPSL